MDIATDPGYTRGRGSHVRTSKRRADRRTDATPAMSRLELAIVVLLVLAVIAAAALSGTRGKTPSASSVRIRVESGATLWTLAEQYPISGLTTEQTVDAIRSANGLDSSVLSAGMSLLVPAARPRARALASR